MENSDYVLIRNKIFDYINSEEKNHLTQHRLYKLTKIERRKLGALGLKTGDDIVDFLFQSHKVGLVEKQVGDICRILTAQGLSLNRILFYLFKIIHGFEVKNQLFVYAVTPNYVNALFLDRYAYFTTSWLIKELWNFLRGHGVDEMHLHNIFNLLVGSANNQRKIFLLKRDKDEKKKKITALYSRTVEGLFCLLNSSEEKEVGRKKIWRHLTGEKKMAIYPVGLSRVVSLSEIELQNPFETSENDDK